MRGIFCLADFHLQSADVTFVCGNEIAQQQTVGYIIPLLGLFLFAAFLYQWLLPHIVHQPLRHKKKPVSQDQLVTSRDLWSGGKDARGQKTQPCPRRGEAMKCHGLPTRPLT